MYVSTENIRIVFFVAILCANYIDVAYSQNRDDWPDTQGEMYVLHGQNIAAYYDDITNTPVRIENVFGANISAQTGITFPTSESAIAAFETLIANHLDLFRFDPGLLSETGAELQTYLGETWFVWKIQLYEGLWVYRSLVTAEFELDGTLHRLSAKVYPNISVDTTPIVDVATAVSIVKNLVSSSAEFTNSEKEFYAGAGLESSQLFIKTEPKNKQYTYSLAWNLLFVDQDSGGGQAIVNAHSGAVYSADGGPLVVNTESLEFPTETELFQNYPNPFAAATTISYRVNQNTRVRLSILDVLGREVALLVDEENGIGTHTVEFDGGHLPAGIYFARLQTLNSLMTKKITLSR